MASKYIALDYIESSGSQYIDSGVSGNNDNLTISVKFNMLSFASYRGVFGNYKSETDNCWRIILTNTDNNRFYINPNTSAGSGTTTMTIEKNVINTVVLNKNEIVINGVATAITKTTKGNDNDNSIIIFSQRPSTSQGATMRLYSFKISNGNSVIRDFVPARRVSDNAIGMYDIVNSKFYSNAGSGAFIAGTETGETLGGYSYIGVKSKKVVLKNMAPPINGTTGFTIGGSSGATRSAEASTTHTKYAEQSLKMSVGSDCAEVTASSVNAYPLDSTHLYYARIEAYQEVACGSVEIYFPIAEPQMFNKSVGSAGKWNIYSVVRDRSTFSSGNQKFRLDFNNANPKQNAEIWYDGVMLIDLTEAFGAGNEPTVEWCDTNIGYFTGEKSIEVEQETSVARETVRAYIGVPTVNNMVENGHFNAFDGWEINKSEAIYSTDGNVLTITANPTETKYIWAQTTKKLSLKAGHKYYCAVNCWKSGGGATAWAMYNATTGTSYWTKAIENSTENYVLQSYCYTATSDAETNVLLYGVTSSWSADFIVKWDNLIVIDLTELYGSGNEPTQANCDYLFSMDGTVVRNADFRAKGVARTIKKAYIGVGGVAKLVYHLCPDTHVITSPTCTTQGYTAHICSTCGESYKDTYVAANGHNYVVVSGKASTCTSTGLTEGQKCSVCGDILVAQEIIPMIAHTPVVSGNTEKCGVCGTFLRNVGLTYYGTITPLSVARQQLAATTVGNYALFGGGSDPNSDNYATVDAYNSSLTRTTSTALSEARTRLTATTIGSYALFGGGSGSSSSATVDAYDSSLTRTTPTALSNGRYDLAATTVGNYALFGGGWTGSSTATVDAYNASLTRTIPTALSQARNDLAATTVGNYALFGGGLIGNTYTGSNSSSVDAYNSSLTRTTPTALSQTRRYLAATTVGNYALFGGGERTMIASYNTVDVYNGSLTRTIPTALNQNKDSLAATTVGNYALFGGGDTDSNYSSTVDAYINYDMQ